MNNPIDIGTFGTDGIGYGSAYTVTVTDSSGHVLGQTQENIQQPWIGCFSNTTTTINGSGNTLYYTIATNDPEIQNVAPGATVTVTIQSNFGKSTFQRSIGTDWRIAPVEIHGQGIPQGTITLTVNDSRSTVTIPISAISQ